MSGKRTQWDQRSTLTRWFERDERDKWAVKPSTEGARYIGLPALGGLEQRLYGDELPRGVHVPRSRPEHPPVNHWMAPHELLEHGFVPGQIIIGKFGGRFLGHLDDRPIVTAAGARAGKTSTVLVPNLYLYPGSMLVLDPKSELSRTAGFRRAMGHEVHVLDPFGQSRESSSCFNALAELDPESPTIIDDVASVTQALVAEESDGRTQHWNDSARTLLKGLILLTLTFEPEERHLITVRELLSLAYPPLVEAVKLASKHQREEPYREQYYNVNRLAVETLLRAMSKRTKLFGGILASIGNRFLSTPSSERGSIFSTAAAQTDFLDSLPLRAISKKSNFNLAALRQDRPTTIFLCLPVGRMESHYRWLRLIVQLACTRLEKMGIYPRDRAPILFMMEEFATLGHMEIMERAAAYFPGFGIKLWAVLQDTTQLQRNYHASWETFLGNAGLIQCFANGDQTTLNYLSGRLENLISPFEIRRAFGRDRFSQILLMEGKAPAAAIRLEHADVDFIRSHVERSIAG